MAGIKTTDSYPWLCNTTKTLSDDSSNIVCDNEKELADAITDDAYGLYGLKCIYYHVSEDLDRDKLFGEDQLREIERSWYFMGYVNSIPSNVRSYQLQGIWGEDTVTMYASINAFKYYSTYGGTDKNTPEVYNALEAMIGDIIYMPQNNYFYRIVDVKYYSEAFGLDTHTYTLTLKVYKDNKWSVSANSPTLSDKNDPIYKVAPESLTAQYAINDTLKYNGAVTASASVQMYNNKFVDKEIKENNPQYYDPFAGW